MKTKGIIKHPVKAGIVIFEELSGDWVRRAKKRSFENGWCRWYSGHYELKDPYNLKVDLLRLRLTDGKLECPPKQIIQSFLT